LFPPPAFLLDNIWREHLVTELPRRPGRKEVWTRTTSSRFAAVMLRRAIFVHISIYDWEILPAPTSDRVGNIETLTGRPPMSSVVPFLWLTLLSCSQLRSCLVEFRYRLLEFLTIIAFRLDWWSIRLVRVVVENNEPPLGIVLMYLHDEWVLIYITSGTWFLSNHPRLGGPMFSL
jgi:hypothetical protein